MTVRTADGRRRSATASTSMTTTVVLLLFATLSAGVLLGKNMTLDAVGVDFTDMYLNAFRCDGSEVVGNKNTSAASIKVSSSPQQPPHLTTTATKTTATPTMQWNDWPAVAHQEVGHPLVFKGDNFYNHARQHYFGNEDAQNNNATQMSPWMTEFLEIYKHRPDPVNLCGIRINHAMALFLAVKVLQPTLVVESGVNAGVSTYFIRKASNTTKIFAIDPLDTPICGQGKRWMDDSPLTTYYTGQNNFVDLLELDWAGMMARKEVAPETTLVFLDDHLHTFERIASCMMKFGVQHVLVEDNYKAGEGATQLDKRSTPKQAFSGKIPQLRKEGEWLFSNLVSYAEFPPLVPPITAKETTVERKKAGGFMVAADTNTDIVAPMLRPDIVAGDKAMYESICEYLELDPSMVDKNSYMQFMNYNQFCYLELVPTPNAVMKFYQTQQAK